MDYLAGIDLGSTSLKCVIYDLAGNTIASATRPTEQVHPDPDNPEWTVWQPEQIWGGAVAADMLEWYQIYKQLYPSLKPISHQLYDQFQAGAEEPRS